MYCSNKPCFQCCTRDSIRQNTLCCLKARHLSDTVALFYHTCRDYYSPMHWMLLKMHNHRANIYKQPTHSWSSGPVLSMSLAHSYVTLLSRMSSKAIWCSVTIVLAMVTSVFPVLRPSVTSGCLACLGSILGKVAFDGETAFHLLAKSSCRHHLPEWVPCNMASTVYWRP